MRRGARNGLLAAWLALPSAAFGQSMLGSAGAGTDQGGPPPAPPPSQTTVAVPPAQPIVSSPLPAPPSAAPMPEVMTPSQTPPGLVQTPVPPANADTGQTGTDGTATDNLTPTTPDAAATTPAQVAPATPDTASSTPPAPANNWVPEHTAQIGLLDKVDGGASTVSVSVGGQTDAGDLRISVLACETRPPTEIPDDAVLVSIQPVPAGPTATAGSAAPAGAVSTSPIFRGWMIRSIPGATVVGDASETLRIIRCS
jgi:hypothetical protein